MVLEVDGLSKIIGIISAAIAEKATVFGQIVSVCDLNNYLVFTDVSKFSDWVNQVIFNTF
jgi:hypothetical protein